MQQGHIRAGQDVPGERMSIQEKEFHTAQSVTEHSIKDKTADSAGRRRYRTWMMHCTCPIYVRRSIWSTEETSFRGAQSTVEKLKEKDNVELVLSDSS